MSKERSILFVCTANQCRSPMAEAIIKDYIKRMDLPTNWIVQSAGTWAENGHPATPSGVKAMALRGLDTSLHRSQSITKDLLKQFDLILTMESGHKEAIQIEFPEFSKKVFMLSEMSGVEINIDDPIGGTFEDYLNTADEIDELISKGLSNILQTLNYPENR
ncbi:MAG: low molecular weight protein arginine phosphatase [Anaerolineaceae bacterium]|nr:low molecular weight protein arginine phosphatase [Anaerolineaceae bacterium]